MKIVSSIFIFILLGNLLYSQIDSVLILKNALTEAEKMNEAFLNRSYDIFIEYSHPKLIEMVGGIYITSDM